MLNRINERVGLVGPLNLAGPCHQLLSHAQDAASRQGRDLHHRSLYAASRSHAAGLGMAAGLLRGWSGTMRCADAASKRFLGHANSPGVRPMVPRNIIVETRRQLEADPGQFGILGRDNAATAELLARAAVAAGCAPETGRTVQSVALVTAAAACQAGALVGVALRVGAAVVGIAAALATMVVLGIRAARAWVPLRTASLPCVAQESRQAIAAEFAAAAEDNSPEAVAQKLRDFVTDLVRARPGSVLLNGVDLAVQPAGADQPLDEAVERQRVNAAVNAALSALAHVCHDDARSQAALAWLLTQRSAGILIDQVRPVTLRGQPQRALHVGDCPQQYTVQSEAEGVRVRVEYQLTPVALFQDWASDDKAFCTPDTHLRYTAELFLRPAQGPEQVPSVELVDVRVAGNVRLLPPDAELSPVQLALA